MQSVYKKNISQIFIWGKFNKKEKKQKISALLENNQPVPQCLAKRRKKKTTTELPKIMGKITQYTK